MLKSGNGKGIVTYYDETKAHPAEQIKREKFQITKFKHNKLDILNIYRSQTGNSLELLEELKRLLVLDRPTLITGDFNACFIENFSNRMIQGLVEIGFDQLVHEPTHIRGRHIDHAYIRDPHDELKPRPTGTPHARAKMNRYSPYYSDHDAI